MSNLKDRLLASIEVHGKCDIYGLLNLYPTESKLSILKALFTLRNEGWIIISKTRMINGIPSNNPNVRRTKKTMYTQPTLINDLD